MALDVTPGGAAANSYLALTDAAAFAAGDYGTDRDLWVAATTSDDQRERSLRRATSDVDEYVRDLGAIAPYVLTQALYFPRWIDVDSVGAALIPRRVKRATYEQAKYVLQNADAIDRAAARRARGLDNFSEPNVSGSLASDPGFGLLAPKAIELLASTGPDGTPLGATIARIVRT